MRAIWILDLVVLMTCAGPVGYGTMRDGFDASKAHHTCIISADPYANICENTVLVNDSVIRGATWTGPVVPMHW